jgi:hypothetical protein
MTEPLSRIDTLTSTCDQLQGEIDHLWRLVTVLGFCVLALAAIGLADDVRELLAGGGGDA